VSAANFAPLDAVASLLGTAGVVCFKADARERACEDADELAAYDEETIAQEETASKKESRMNARRKELQAAESRFQHTVHKLHAVQTPLLAAEELSAAAMQQVAEAAVAVAAAAARWRNAALSLKGSLRVLSDVMEPATATAKRQAAEDQVRTATEAAARPVRFVEPENKKYHYWSDKEYECLIMTAVSHHEDWSAVSKALQDDGFNRTPQQCRNKFCHNVRELSLPAAVPTATAVAVPPDASSAAAVPTTTSPAAEGAAAAAADAAAHLRLPKAKVLLDLAVKHEREALDYAAAMNEAQQQLTRAQQAAHDTAQLAWLCQTTAEMKADVTVSVVVLLEEMQDRVSRQLVKTMKAAKSAAKRRNEYQQQDNWVLRCYTSDGLHSIRNAALLSLKANFFNNVKQHKADGRAFSLHFKTRKQRQISFSIPWSNWANRNGFWSQLRNRNLCRVARYRVPDSAGKPLASPCNRHPGCRSKDGCVRRKTRALPTASSPQAAHHDLRLLQKRDGPFYLTLHFGVKTIVAGEKQAGGWRWASCDPGVRRMLSVLDLKNQRLVKIGDRAVMRIQRMCRQRDQLALRCRSDLQRCAPGVFEAQRSARWPMNHHRRWNMRRALARLDRRIRDTVDGMHRDVCKWLCTQFDVILLPEFSTSQMLHRKGRRISKQTARNLQMLAFHRFQKLLVAMAKRHGCMVIICTEEWTSKTCPCCGHINRNIGGSLLFSCEQCAFTTDRDLVGAINIFLKHATAHKLKQQQQQQQAHQPGVPSVGVPLHQGESRLNH
jgi:hypothetical protein